MAEGVSGRETGKAAWYATLALCTVVFVSGGVLMGVEIAGSRVLAPSFGTSIFVWGSLIGLFMMSLAIGYYLGGLLADWKPSFSVLASLVSLAGVSVLFVPQVGYELCDAIARADLGLRLGSLAASAALFSVPCLLMGMVSPFAVKLQASSLAHLGNVAGKLYALSTAGSIVGTLVTSFWLIPAFNVLNVLRAFGIALILVAIASLLLFRSASGGLDRGTLTAVGVMFACACIGTAAWAHSAEIPRGRKGSRILAYRDSPYHQILIAEQVLGAIYDSQGLRIIAWDEKDRDAQALEMFFNENLESGIYAHSERYVNSVTYTDVLHLATIWVPKPKKVLIVGLGGGVLPMQFAEAYGCTVDVFEIDEDVEEMAREYFRLASGDRIRVHIGDGRQLVRRSAERYDVIMLDAYSSGGQIPFHLLTKEFISEVREKLAPGGVLMANVISALDGDKGRIYRSAYKTIREGGAFRSMYTFPKLPLGTKMYDRERWTKDMINVIIAATDEEKAIKKEEILRIAKERVSGKDPVVKVDAEAFLHHAGNMLEAKVSPAELDREGKDAPVLSDRHSPVDVMYRRD
ncbi:MAG: fused MFS/spermidine synthase [Planctomycetota bacterium]|nr:fused MFS/spermidine synthase [Planctomycetota bacterium]